MEIEKHVDTGMLLRNKSGRHMIHRYGESRREGWDVKYDSPITRCWTMRIVSDQMSELVSE